MSEAILICDGQASFVLSQQNARLFWRFDHHRVRDFTHALQLCFKLGWFVFEDVFQLWQVCGQELAHESATLDCVLQLVRGLAKWSSKRSSPFPIDNAVDVSQDSCRVAL